MSFYVLGTGKDSHRGKALGPGHAKTLMADLSALTITSNGFSFKGNFLQADGGASWTESRAIKHGCMKSLLCSDPWLLSAWIAQCNKVVVF